MLTTEEYSVRKEAFLAYKDTLTKEPSGDVKKEYYVGCYQKSDWEFIHEELKKDGSLEDNIPSSTCDCSNDCLHSDTNAIYLLTDSEATSLRNHPKVEYVDINADAYPGTYQVNPDDEADEKDIKIGDDKRPVQIVPKDEDFLYNIANGEILRDEFGNPLITEIDTLYLPSVTAAKSTSVVFDDRTSPYVQEDHTWVSPSTGSASRYADLDHHLGTYLTVKLANGSNYTLGQATAASNTVQVGGGGTCKWYDLSTYENQAGISTSKVWPTGGASFTPPSGLLPENHPVIKLENDVGDAKNILYVDTQVGITSLRGAKVGDTVYGSGIPEGTQISDITNNGRIVLSNDLTTPTRPVGKYRRYAGVQKSQRTINKAYYGYSGDSLIDNNPDNSLNNRVPLQIARHQGKGDPWRAVANAGINSTGTSNYSETYGTYSGITGTITTDIIAAQDPAVGHVPADIARTDIRQHGDGSDVDVIVCDQDMWFGHIEFVNVGAASSTKPINYRGGNVLKAGYATHSATGICDVLDLVLDAPYYLDPEFFDANAAKRTTRWDGTVVPTDAAAIAWWGNNSTTHRSAKFVSSGSGGSATGNNDFGTITVTAGYTRANSNGSNTAYKTGTGYHGTPCASQAFGKTHGWAYNANKWFINQYGTNSTGHAVSMNIQKIFHQCKPVNPKYGTKDPTISSNSWSRRYAPLSSGYYYFRQGTSGSGGVSFASKPPFMDNYADGQRVPEFISGAWVTAGNQLIDAGVIYCVASSNRGQKIVKSDHPDYNNYASSSSAQSLAATAVTTSDGNYVRTQNRPGMPAQIGKDNGDGTVTYKTIIVGAIDDNYMNATGKKERRVHYSNVGNAVDCFACGDDTLAAADNRTATRYDRYDPFYVHSSTTSLESEERVFGGTSSACPVAAGLIATKLQYNREWTWSDVKDWLNDKVGVVEEEVFYHGTEATTATDTAWTDRNSLQGAKATVIWDAPTGKEWSELSSGALGQVFFRRASMNVKTTDPVWKIEEQFRESSEVSRTLLGIDRAETQLSLFSNVSSYGLDSDEFESFTWATGISQSSWESRSNKIYGNRFQSKVSEVTQESGIKLESFPVQYSFPFGPNWARLGYYDATKFSLYKNFINMGNDLYDIFNDATIAPYNTYPSTFKDRFLNRSIAYVSGSDMEYAAGYKASFAQIDTWTDTWIEILKGGARFIDPVSNKALNFGNIQAIIKDYNNKKRTLVPSWTDFVDDRDQDNTKPGYNSNYRRFAQLQSRRVFRYQPGRISGFTFGVKSSKESIDGSQIEWGISNNTDQYVFMVNKGNLSIVRRSTIPLPDKMLRQQGLKTEFQKTISNGGRASGDPFDVANHYVLEISSDYFNGDPLNGNGPSKYTLQPDQVTMYKIEFGWYGAIGARFYAYIPTGNGDARWVTIHTLVIENYMSQPCLVDSYFRLIYRLNITDTSVLREPQFVTKYGASYYIDGGDEGTVQMYSANSGVKKITGISSESLLAIKPKDFIMNSLGTEIVNKKLIIPTQLNISSGALTEVKTVVCKGCPGFGHVHTSGLTVGDNGRIIPAGDIIFTNTKTMQALNTSYFTEDDIGAKIISPSINNAYIKSVSSQSGTPGQYLSAEVESNTNATTRYSRNVFGPLAPTLDQVTNTVGIHTLTSGGTNYVHPHPIKLSQFNGVAVSDFAFTGNKIEIQFTNPNIKDDYGKWADFQIGLTDIKPQVTGTADANAEITGWIRDTSTGIVDAATVVPTEDEFIFGRHNHWYESLNEDGDGIEESWPTPNPPLMMGLDYRIPVVSNPGGGVCSKLTFEIANPTYISGVEYLANKAVDPSTGGPTTGGTQFYLQLKNSSFPNLNYGGGQVAIKTTLSQIDPITGDPKIVIEVQAITYVGEVKTYTQPGPGGTTDTFNFIEISSSLSSTYAALSPNINLAFRPVKATGNGGINISKLFNYTPFPLYMVFKGMDQATINSISVKETIGNFSRTITPRFFVLPSTNTSITNAGGNATRGDAPTHFEESARLSSAEIDQQNEQKIRDGYKVIDTVYIGANTTKQIDLTPVFGADRVVITPDNNNIESTFLIAKRVDGVNDEADMEATITFKEQ